MSFVSITKPIPGATWQAWTPTYSAGGSMTFTSVTTNIARYVIIGKTVHFQIGAKGTTGGTASNYIGFTLPITAANTDQTDVGGGAMIIDGSSGDGAGAWATLLAGDIVRVFKPDFANWALGTNREIVVNGTYEIA